ncbi:MAG: hypothetical protein GXP63_07005 [DPANN group archaeon]|nr:hypothetical protein [DPANN group archaeon]
MDKKKRKIRLRNPLRTIAREDLGTFQVERLRRFKNITIRTGTAMTKINENAIVTSNGERIGYRYLVGADGAASRVRNHLGLKRRISMGIQYILPTKAGRVVWYNNPRKLGAGYGWVFPHRKFTSAGIFFDPRRINMREAKEALHDMLREMHIPYEHARFEGAPVNCLYEGIKHGNIFLAGDAAGVTSALTGEGISFAMATGKDIAEHILGTNTSFRYLKQILKYKRRQERLLAIANLVRSPWLQKIGLVGFINLLRFPWFQKYIGN